MLLNVIVMTSPHADWLLADGSTSVLDRELRCAALGERAENENGNGGGATMDMTNATTSSRGHGQGGCKPRSSRSRPRELN
jgi:hypothetical protein